MSIKQNIDKIKNKIPKNIILIAATKTRTTEQIQQAIDAGIKDIGENYVQEAENKHNQLKNQVKFHLIGHLQSNKAKKAATIFDMVQTIDSIKIANTLNKHCEKINKTMPVLIEVNIAEEPQKSGCRPDEIETIAQHIQTLTNLKLQGLMTMAPYTENPEDSRKYFKRMNNIFKKLKTRYNLTILSMGMSNTYKIAMEEDSTMVRIGTKLFT